MGAARIMIVEDEAIVARDIRARLGLLGFQVVGMASRGEEAVVLAGAQRPDLILMDIRLQGQMDGIEAAMQIRQRWHLPIVFLTAYSEEATVERAIVVEPSGFLLKPFEDQELARTIQIGIYKHRANEEIRRLNRVHASLSQVNQAISRLHSREALLPAICRILVESGRFQVAWIGWLNSSTRRVEPVAQWGESDDFLASLDAAAGDPCTARHPTEAAVSAGQASVENNWRSSLDEGGGTSGSTREKFQSAAAFPIRFRGAVRGALTVYSDEPEFFQETEVSLLNDVAMDVSYALDNMEKDAERNRAEEQLRQHRDHLEELVHERTVELESKNAQLAAEIAERSKIEDDLRVAKEAAEGANRAKSAFLARMSHEIRTPMNAILGFSQLMQRDPTLTPQQRQRLDAISRGGEHLLALINDVLEMSKIEAGRISLHPSPFDLLALLEDLETMFRLRANVKGLTLTVEHIEPLPRFVVADESKLRQVFINLLGNAVKFTDKGQITVRVRCQREKPAHFRLFAEVQDTGPGISAEDIQRLFQPFEQTAIGRRASEGAGLGLAICRETARLMNGDVTVRSEPGRGAIFSFEVLLETADSAPPPVAQTARQVVGIAPGQATRRILIADDVESNREFLAQLLEPLGFEVCHAEHGEEALRQFHQLRPDLILIDLKMPLIEGCEVIRRIRAREDGRDVKIIAVTASVFAESQREVLDAGADDFALKPLCEATLLETIGRLLELIYVYAEAVPPARPESPEPLNEGELSLLSAEHRDQVREAAINCDFHRLLELSQQLEVAHPRLAAGLHDAAENFQFQRLLDLLDAGDPTHDRHA